MAMAAPRSNARLPVREQKRSGAIHDCRHAFASRALALGESLPVIAKLLGHRQIWSTSR